MYVALFLVPEGTVAHARLLEIPIYDIHRIVILHLYNPVNYRIWRFLPDFVRWQTVLRCLELDICAGNDRLDLKHG